MVSALETSLRKMGEWKEVLWCPYNSKTIGVCNLSLGNLGRVYKNCKQVATSEGLKDVQ
jgi:hypothetical protein